MAVLLRLDDIGASSCAGVLVARATLGERGTRLRAWGKTASSHTSIAWSSSFSVPVRLTLMSFRVLSSTAPRRWSRRDRKASSPSSSWAATLPGGTMGVVRLDVLRLKRLGGRGGGGLGGAPRGGVGGQWSVASRGRAGDGSPGEDSGEGVARFLLARAAGHGRGVVGTY